MSRIQRRTEDTAQRLETLLNSASKFKDDHSLVESFSRWDVALYIRHVLQGVPLEDHSLVDRLIDWNEDSFEHAVISCRFICHYPAQTPQYRIRLLVEHRSDTLSLPMRMFNHTLTNLDNKIHSQIKQMPFFHDITTNNVGWEHLYQLHHHIARICLRTMNNSLRPNICLIPSSYVRTNGAHIQQLVDLARREGQITSALVYSCSHWGYHASFSVLEADNDVAELAVIFLQSHALQWLEVISLIRKNASKALCPLSESYVSGANSSCSLGVTSNCDTFRFLTSNSDI